MRDIPSLFLSVTFLDLLAIAKYILAHILKYVKPLIKKTHTKMQTTKIKKEPTKNIKKCRKKEKKKVSPKCRKAAIPNKKSKKRTKM